MIMNMVAFVLQVYFPGATDALAAGPGQPWYTLITHMFLHAGIQHLFGNMIFTAGYALYYESLVGNYRFLRDWLVCGVGAVTFYLCMPSLMPAGLIGASGACSGILALALLHFRRNVVYEALTLAALTILFLSNLIPGILDCFIPSGVGHMAHVGGILTGILIYCFDSKTYKKVNREKHPS